MQTTTANSANGRLETLSVVRVKGPDACTYLQAQWSNDVASLVVGSAAAAAYLSPKGRVLAIATMARREDEQFELFVDTSIAEDLVRRLSILIFRSKVEIELLQNPVTGSAKGSGYEYFGGPRRVSTESDAETAVDDAWLAADISAGIPRLIAETQDAFTAHALGLDRLDALNYKKGCYPGQEVVARTRHLGRGKRHPYLVTSEQALTAGDELRGERGSVGRIVTAVNTDGWNALAVLHESAESAPLETAGGGTVSIVHRYP